VAAALAALSPEEREVLLLYAWAELNYDEIARALDLPVGTVRSRLNRARGKAADSLAAVLTSPPEGAGRWTS
jgi:RNA polymerase sigma factor (sigma-70 family)